MEEAITHLSGRPHGVSADQLVRHLKDTHSAGEHYRVLLVHTQEEFGLDQDAIHKEADLEERLRMHRARRVQTDLLTVAGPPSPRNTPQWRVRYRHNGTFRAHRCAPLPTGDLGDQITSARATPPPPILRNGPCPTWSASAIA